jgi:hypothetical protein
MPTARRRRAANPPAPCGTKRKRLMPVRMLYVELPKGGGREEAARVLQARS